jgi:hypothetical protein
VTIGYERAFGERIEHPAIYNDPTNGGCKFERHITTTAYLKSTQNRGLVWLDWGAGFVRMGGC